MNQTTLHLVFKAMLYTARKEGFTVDEKYTDLEEKLLNEYDYDVTDMMDNLSIIYYLIKFKDEGEDKDKIIEQQELYMEYLLQRLRIAEASRKEAEK